MWFVVAVVVLERLRRHHCLIFLQGHSHQYCYPAPTMSLRQCCWRKFIVRLQNTCNAHTTWGRTHNSACTALTPPCHPSAPGPLSSLEAIKQSHQLNMVFRIIRWHCALLSSEKIISKSGTEQISQLGLIILSDTNISPQFIVHNEQCSQAVKSPS